MFKVKLHEPKPIVWWERQFRAGALDMEPRFQRKSNIWSKWKKAHLIDSIINEFDIPKFYVCDFTQMRSSSLNKKQTRYAIIDGKQRLETIFEFLNGELQLNKTMILISDPEIKLGGLDYHELKRRYPNVAARLEQFSPVVMSVLTDNARRIDDMFIRLNSGEHINRAEKRNAWPGPLPRIIRDLTMHPFFRHKISFITKRAQDANLAAKLMLIEYEGRFHDTKANDLDKFFDRAAAETGEKPGSKQVDNRDAEAAERKYRETQARVYQVLESLSEHFDDRDKLLSAQSHVIIYYWMAREGVIDQDFHDFLKDFNARVSDNNKIAREDSNKADQTLLTFYTRGRTSNDRGSMEDRYKIILQEYKRYRQMVA